MSFNSFSNSLFNLLIYIKFVSCFSRREFSVLYSFYFFSVNLFIKLISYVAAPSNEFVELGLESRIMATYDDYRPSKPSELPLRNFMEQTLILSCGVMPVI